jgi:hypothetical protein
VELKAGLRIVGSARRSTTTREQTRKRRLELSLPSDVLMGGNEFVTHNVITARAQACAEASVRVELGRCPSWLRGYFKRTNGDKDAEVQGRHQFELPFYPFPIILIAGRFPPQRC